MNGLTLRRRAAAAEGGVAPAFDPTDVTGLNLFVEADSGAFSDDAGTTPSTNGGGVNRLNDKSGLANDLIRSSSDSPVYVTGEVNGHPVLRFDAVLHRHLSNAGTALAQPNTIFVVANAASKSDYRPLAASAGSGSGNDAIYINNGDGRLTAYAGSLVVGSAGDWTGAWHVFEVVINGASSSWYVDGAAAGTGDLGSNTWFGYRLGSESSGSFKMHGDIAAFLVYNTLVSSTDRDSVRAYLGTKYGITVV